MRILIPLKGLIDKEAELNRLEKELGKLRVTLKKGETKLQNAGFVERAPADVVDKERARVAELRSALAHLEEQVIKIRAL
jgi:valyl-tRNA synthetase